MMDGHGLHLCFRERSSAVKSRQKADIHIFMYIYSCIFENKISLVLAIQVA